MVVARRWQAGRSSRAGSSASPAALADGRYSALVLVVGVDVGRFPRAGAPSCSPSAPEARSASNTAGSVTASRLDHSPLTWPKSVSHPRLVRRRVGGCATAISVTNFRVASEAICGTSSDTTRRIGRAESSAVRSSRSGCPARVGPRSPRPARKGRPPGWRTSRPTPGCRSTCGRRSRRWPRRSGGAREKCVRSRPHMRLGRPCSPSGHAVRVRSGAVPAQAGQGREQPEPAGTSRATQTRPAQEPRWTTLRWPRLALRKKGRASARDYVLHDRELGALVGNGHGRPNRQRQKQ